jgi:Iap family predicted aminopeptidase
MSDKIPVLDKYRKELIQAQTKTLALENAYEKIKDSKSFNQSEKENVRQKLIEELRKEKECLKQIDQRTKIYNELHEITMQELEERSKLMKEMDVSSSVFELFPCLKKSLHETQSASLLKVKTLLERTEN